MVKTKSIWCCVECGHSQSKWSGQCSSCEKWNTLHEEEPLPVKRFDDEEVKGAKPVKVDEASLIEEPRMLSHIGEFDRLLGGGVVKGSLSLVGGDPGIGKSTLMLQVSSSFAKQGLSVLYVCGEESVSQVSMRAKRLGIGSESLYLFSETNLTTIKQQIKALNPDVVVIDSIQILYKNEISSAPGSVSQVRETATEMMHLAKGRNIATFLIGHVTKAGEIAGPRVLEHIVDTVLYFQGDHKQGYRLMRATKNRFGSADEIAVFQMDARGLKEVPNPSKLFLEERRDNHSGSVIIPTLEGSRPILVEVQALVTESPFSTPTRRSTGIDPNRLALLLAVMEKRGGYQLYHHDVFVSIAGGVRIDEPAADLGILTAIASSLLNRPCLPSCALIGEVGLGGEVRSAARVESRLKELVQMGFTCCILPSRNKKGIAMGKEIELIGVEHVKEGINAALC
ncbi:MAG: DNA repair protein RadA [Chlamydiia bacterium]|nr:DNA repair protein RadA [Chlamydiia bacterium]